MTTTDPSTGLLTDHYELTMLQAALRSGAASRRCVFEVFARRHRAVVLRRDAVEDLLGELGEDLALVGVEPGDDVLTTALEGAGHQSSFW